MQGYVSVGAYVARAVLFVGAISVVGAVCRQLQYWIGWLWLVPTVLFGAFLYVRAGRWTGGRVLRRRIAQDLRANAVRVHNIRPREAILFEEREDEGPIVFLLDDSGDTLAFTGQELARYVARGFPWQEFEIREGAHSQRFLGLERTGAAVPLAPSLVRPPLSADQYEQLDLGALTRWGRLDVAFDVLRRVA